MMKRRSFLTALLYLPVSPHILTFITDEESAFAFYKGKTTYDAALFYCPYVPLQYADSEAPTEIVTFKTRYGELNGRQDNLS